MPIVVSNHQGLAARISNAFSRVARFALSIGVGWCQQPPWLFNHADLCVCCNRRFYIAVLCGISQLSGVLYAIPHMHYIIPIPYIAFYIPNLLRDTTFFFITYPAVWALPWHFVEGKKIASFFVSMSNKQWSLVWKWCVFIKLYRSEIQFTQVHYAEFRSRKKIDFYMD